MVGFKWFLNWKKELSLAQAFILLFVTFMSFAPSTVQATDIESASESLLFQDFENGDGFAAGSGATVTADTYSTNPGGTISALMVSDNGDDWPNNTGNYIEIMPKESAAADISEYDNLIFYVRDAGSGNNPEVSLFDVNGNKMSGWNNTKTVQDGWVQYVVPLSELGSVDGFDPAKVVKIRIGFWNKSTYWFDDVSFQENGETETLSPSLFQDFEGTSGYASGDSGATVVPETLDIAVGSGSQSVKMSLVGSGMPDSPFNSLIVNSTSGDPADTSGYSFLNFYLKDTQGVNTVYVTIKDANGHTASSWTDAKSVKNEWTLISIPFTHFSGIDWSAVTEIGLGEWNSGVYYFDDVYFAQNASDLLPGFITPTYPAVFQDFENGDGFAAGSGATAALDTDRANLAEAMSVRLVTSENNSALVVTPDNGEPVNATAYAYLNFFVKDTGGSNNLNVSIQDDEGNVWSGWTSGQSVKNQWTKISLPLSEVSGIDLSAVAQISLAEYWPGTYYFDIVYFSQKTAENVSGFQNQPDNVSADWFQNFEYGTGFSAASGGTAEIDNAESANPSGMRSVKLTLAEDSGDNTLNSVVITPQQLAASLDPGNKYEYSTRFDATFYNYFVFYVLDSTGLSGVHVTMKDMDGGSWDFWTNDIDASLVSQQGQWTRIAVPLDKSQLNWHRLHEIRLGEWNQGIYHFDELYFAADADDPIPGGGYTTFQMRSVGSDLIPYQNGVPLASFEKQRGRDYLQLNGAWKKLRVDVDESISAGLRDSAGVSEIEAEANGKFNAEFDDSSWQAKTLPMPENERINPEHSTNGGEQDSFEDYQGGVWYRKHFTPDDSWSGKNVKLAFLGVNYFADVWINGTYVGGHAGGYTPFGFDVSDLLQYGKDNVIAVRVDNPRWNTFNQGETIPYKQSDWFNYTGIMRDVYLEASDSTYIVRSDVKPLDASGSLQIKTVLNNKFSAEENVSLSYRVYEAVVNDANKASEFAEDLLGTPTDAARSAALTLPAGSPGLDSFTLDVPNPKLWSPANPNLYVLKVTASVNGSPVDEFYTQFGIRTLQTNGAQIMLNGEVAPFLVGTGRTEDSFDKGPALGNSDIYRDFEIIRNTLKANFVRTGHSPSSLNSYYYTDRLGLAVWQEIPAYWFDGEAFNLVSERGTAKQMFREMIYSNYNRPSIWFNGTANESGSQLERTNYITDLKLDAKEIDGTRLIGQSAVSNKWQGEDDNSHVAADVVGMTMYYGIFYGQNPDLETRESIQDLHAMFPDKPIIATEYGYWSTENDALQTKQTQMFNATFNAFAGLAVRNEDGSINPDGIFSGAAWWTAFNWYSGVNANSDAGHEQTMGLLHMDRVTKKQVTDILAERYGRYTHNEGSTPQPAGLREWFQNFESASGYSAGSDTEATFNASVNGDSGSSSINVQLTADGPAYLDVSPLGGNPSKNVSYHNYLNFYVKDEQGSGKIQVTLFDSSGASWTTEAPGQTVMGQWVRFSVPLGSNVSGINNLDVKKVRLSVSGAGTYSFDNLYFSTYASDALPQASAAGKSVWYQTFEQTAAVTAGENASAAITTGISATSAGTNSVRLDVTGDGEVPGATKRNVSVLPQSGDTFDATGFNYLIFYVKDTQGSNTVDVALTDADGNTVDAWTDDTSSVQNIWTKMVLPLDKVISQGLDISKITDIRLGEWNSGTYYFDDLYFAQNTTDDIPDNMQDVVSMPVADPPSGTFSAPVTVTLSASTSGASIYYTLDGSFPTSSGQLYTGPIKISRSATLKAIAVKLGMLGSETAAFTYSITGSSSSSGYSDSSGKVTNSDGSVTVTDYMNDIVTVEYDSKAIEAKLVEASKGTEKAVIIELPDSDVRTQELELSSDAVGALSASPAGVTVKAAGAQLQIPAALLKTANNDSIKIQITTVDDGSKNTLLASKAKEMNAAGPIKEFRIIAGEGPAQHEITTFDSKVKINLSVSPDDQAKIDVKKLGIYFFHETLQSWQYVGGQFDPAADAVTAETGHFTKFAVMEYNKTYADVEASSWAKSYIELLAARHITLGVDDSRFDPKGTVTRAQFAAFIARALGLDTGEYAGTFSDVKKGKWFDTAVEAVQEAGIVQGVDEDRFAPDAPISREEMVVMVMRAYTYLNGKAIADEANASKASFHDADSISDWAKEDVVSAQAEGLIDGTGDNLFSPKNGASREQVAAILIRLLEKAGKL
ncbi:MAG: S-layer homology domain-containing protein [Bacillota bacterium]